MLLNRNTIFPAAVTAKPIQYALGALRRDFDRIFAATAAPGGRLRLTINHTLAAEQYTLTAGTDTLLLSASDDLGFVYGLFEISRHFLGVQPFWFWNDQPFEVRESVKIPTNTVIESKPARVTYRGWFINDEMLLSHWKVERRADLPQQGDDGVHGIYYHASFYDLQAASHITMLPNSTEFVSQELTDVLIHGADDYWLINCSNIKLYAFLLDLIARCWRDGTVDAVQQSIAYTVAYYGLLHRSDVAQCLTDYAQFTVPYGPNEDDRAGDQFYNHVPRMLISQFVKDRTSPADDLRWLFDVPTLAEQSTHCAEIFQKAAENYAVYLRQ